MKNVLFASLIVLASGASYACPNLTGEWVCNANSDTPSYIGLKSINLEGEKYLLFNTQVGSVRDNKTYVIGEAPRQSSCSKYSVELKNGANHTIYTIASRNKLVVTRISPDVVTQTCERMKK